MSDAATILAQELTCLAFCWRLERRDGVTIGLTSHDRDLRVGGVVYRAAPGMVPSAIQRGSGLGAGLYDFGRLRWLTGRLAGLSADIIAHDDASVTLADAPRSAPEPGVLVQLWQGCDGRIETCADRFANAANFRGEPYLPGNDLLTRYPGGN